MNAARRAGPRSRSRGPSVVVLLVALVAGACGGDEPERVAAPPGSGTIAGMPGEEHLVPGPRSAGRVTAENPYAGDAWAMQEGERLYGWYNCGGCHGELGGGGMGPPLRDEDWIYGGDPVSIYESIMEGRPEGMPTWQGKIPPDQGWQIVAFIQSLGEGYERQPALTPPEDRLPESGGAADQSPGEQ